MVDIYGIDHGIYSDFDLKQPISGSPISLTGGGFLKDDNGVIVIPKIIWFIL